MHRLLLLVLLGRLLRSLFLLLLLNLRLLVVCKELSASLIRILNVPDKLSNHPLNTVLFDIFVDVIEVFPLTAAGSIPFFLGGFTLRSLTVFSVDSTVLHFLVLIKSSFIFVVNSNLASLFSHVNAVRFETRDLSFQLHGLSLILLRNLVLPNSGGINVIIIGSLTALELIESRISIIAANLVKGFKSGVAVTDPCGPGKFALSTDTLVINKIGRHVCRGAGGNYRVVDKSHVGVLAARIKIVRSIGVLAILLIFLSSCPLVSVALLLLISTTSSVRNQWLGDLHEAIFVLRGDLFHETPAFFAGNPLFGPTIV